MTGALLIKLLTIQIFSGRESVPRLAGKHGRIERISMRVGQRPCCCQSIGVLLLLLDSRGALDAVLMWRVASGPCVDADSVPVPRLRSSGQKAIHLGFGVHAQLVAELRRRQAEDGLIG